MLEFLIACAVVAIVYTGIAMLVFSIVYLVERNAPKVMDGDAAMNGSTMGGREKMEVRISAF
jgi:hypothetical protein